MALSIAGVLVAGGLLGWLLLGGDGNDEEVDDGNAGGGQQPIASVSPALSPVASEFALEYVLHAIEGDHGWLRERTIDGFYEFSQPWFERLSGCVGVEVRAGSAKTQDDASNLIASVTFDPPCQPDLRSDSGTTWTLTFDDASVSSADLGQALAELGHGEAQVLTTSDGAFIIRTAELEGLPGPPIGPAPPSERDIIEQALRDSLGDFQVLNFSQFVGAGGAGPYACVLLRVEDNLEPKATITSWPTDEAHCSPDSPNFGSGFGDPSMGPAYVLLEADTSRLAPGTDIGDALEGVKDVLERRADSFGAPIELRREGSNRLSAVMWGIDPDEARELLGKTAQLEFLKPVRDDVGFVVCETPSGGTYVQPYQSGGVFVENEANDTVICPPNEEGTVGVMTWEPATGTDSQGTERALTGSFLKANSRVEGPPPTVIIEFTGEGSLLFQQITTELVGLPLGIFLDEELVGAPIVNQPITGGSSTITGLDFDEARTLSIQLNAGALPLPIRVIQESALVE